MRSRGPLLAVAGVVLVVGLFLVLRPTGPSGEEVATPAPPSVSSEPEDAASAAPNPEATEIEIEVEEGQVDGPGQASVTVGDEVVLRVTADVADEVHLHGYDLHVDLEPGLPGELRFTADAPGVFEAELEDAGIRILSLTVEP